MTLLKDALEALRKIVLIDERISILSSRVESLAEVVASHEGRLSRLEGKFELIERMGGRARRLPPR